MCGNNKTFNQEYSIIKNINERGPIQLAWVLGHSEITGNELADKEAKSAIHDGDPVLIKNTKNYFKRLYLYREKQ